MIMNISPIHAKKYAHKKLSKILEIFTLALDDYLTSLLTSCAEALAIRFPIHFNVCTMPSVSIGILAFQIVVARF